MSKKKSEARSTPVIVVSDICGDLYIKFFAEASSLLSEKRRRQQQKFFHFFMFNIMYQQHPQHKKGFLYKGNHYHHRAVLCERIFFLPSVGRRCGCLLLLCSHFMPFLAPREVAGGWVE